MRMVGNSKLLDKTFISKGILDNVSLANSRSYKVSREPVTTVFEDTTPEKYKTQAAKRMAEYTGVVLFGFDDALSYIYAVASMFGLDPNSLILNFSQIPKMVSYLRFLNLYFGEIFENFLADIGDSVDPKQPYYADSIVFSDVGNRGKLTVYNRPVIFVPIYKTNAVLYFLSWIFRFIAILLLKKAKEVGRITKGMFYFIHYQRKAHFIIFGVSMLGGFQLACRTLLHMSLFLSEFNLFVDKMASMFFVILMSTDFLEMINFPFSYRAFLIKN